MQRIGRNAGGYFGEQIDLSATLAACDAAAQRHGWQRDILPPFELARPAYFRKSAQPSVRRFYISTGMHGDEPAGPPAAQRLLEENIWPDADLWLIPCLNPTGLRASTRTNSDGVDINRDYRHFRTAEARGHVDWLMRQPAFNLALMLHEDWESHGFYTYELNQQNLPSLAPAMVSAVRAVCPVDESPMIDGREVSEPGIIRPNIAPQERPEWPEALWLGVNKVPISYTLEAPSDWPLSVRIGALVTAVNAALSEFAKNEVAVG
ncbi:MAG TPA: M14 family metallocarboxypeptidase [Verrucomicrobiota bacterium]|nr:succinylglutamate desuccinylase [Verrucomicrobiales bacterium]HRI13637.1 M14 family metallocarboxypeptidase [Verrucomicrobiota bacterium]